MAIPPICKNISSRDRATPTSPGLRNDVAKNRHCAAAHTAARAFSWINMAHVFYPSSGAYDKAMASRRSRMRRTRTGKSLALTPRDLALFRLLANYRYLRSTYLHAFAGGLSETRFKERLGDLFHEGFLDRPEQQWMFVDARSTPVVYEIGERARAALAERYSRAAARRTFL